MSNTRKIDDPAGARYHLQGLRKADLDELSDERVLAAARSLWGPEFDPAPQIVIKTGELTDEQRAALQSDARVWCDAFEISDGQARAIDEHAERGNR